MSQDEALDKWLEAELLLIREQYRKMQGNWQRTANWDKHVCAVVWRAAVKHTLEHVANKLRMRAGTLNAVDSLNARDARLTRSLAEFVVKMKP